MAVKRKRTSVGKFAPVTQERIFDFLVNEADATILFDDGESVKVTPQAVRDKGIIVCSDCGTYNSDSLSNCKYCYEKLIYVKPK